MYPSVSKRHNKLLSPANVIEGVLEPDQSSFETMIPVFTYAQIYVARMVFIPEFGNIKLVTSTKNCQ